jgi:non-ribosomal peptide synthase protein (TIGR01720 family)
LGEIEVRLTGHEDVEEAVVIADRNASGDQHLVAYVRGAAAVELDGEALRSYLQASLPPYMIPAACVAVETWPVLPSGKLNRKALPIPDVTQPSQTAYAPPRSGLERKLVQIWQKLLPVDNVGVRDDFLELGGSSMIAMKVVLAASENGISLAVGDLFRHRTIAELADRMGEYRSSVEDDESSVGTVPLTAGMRRFLYERKTPEPHHWNVCTLLEPAEPLEIGQLEEAVRHLVARHDSLRLRFCIRNGEWKAFYKEDAHRGVFSRMDLSALPPEEQLSAVERACIGIQTGFDLEMGPLLRVAYFDLGPERAHRVFVCAHHLVVDGMSLGTLVEDFGSTYHTLGGAPAPGRSRARVSYGQWAKRLERYSQSEQLQQELPFWKGLPWSACATLPRDYDCGDESNTNESARQVVVALSPGDTAALLDFLPKWAKPDDVLLAALSQALADWGGATSVLIDQISHGREPIDGGPAPSLTIGFLIAYRPLVLFVDPASTPMETVASIAKQLRQVPSAGTGFDLLRYRPGSELAELPRAEVLFNYLGSQQDIITSTGPLFRLSEDPHGSIYGPRGRRQYALSVAAAKGSDGLDVRFVYSENLHRRETVERLAAKFRERLEVVARTELRQ